MNNKNKSVIGIVVLVVAVILLCGLLFWDSMKDEKMSTDVYEAQQLELFSAAMYDDLEAAKEMDYASAQDYIINSLNKNRKTYNSDSVDLASLKMLNFATGDTSNNTSSLLDGLDTMLDGFDLDSLLGGLLGDDSDTSMRTLTMKSNTVCQAVVDQKYCVDKLSANVYITDVNSNKWAVLIHGMMMSGSLMYSSVGSMYEAQGYNIIAPDLRGFGDSDGSVAMGYLESLDVYDWIKDLNTNWNNTSRYGVNVAPETIVVHGISLGGATTLQLATNPDIANANGNEPYTKNLTELNVKGFVDDCGYTSMSGIITGMLSGGDTGQMSSLFSSLDIDKVDFMSELQNLIESSNIEGFDQYDFDDLASGENQEDYYKYFEQFSEQFGELEKAIDSYTESNSQYQNQIPGIDKNTWESLVEEYSNNYENNYSNGLTNLLPTNSSGVVNPVVINNSSNSSSDVLDGLIGKVLMSLVGVGLTDDNYDKYSNVFSSGRQFPVGSKVVIIHGTNDTTVPHSNADTIASNVSPATLLHKWDADGMPHAFIVVGSNKTEYTNLITNFTNCVNNSSCTSISR